MSCPGHIGPFSQKTHMYVIKSRNTPRHTSALWPLTLEDSPRQQKKTWCGYFTVRTCWPSRFMKPAGSIPPQSLQVLLCAHRIAMRCKEMLTGCNVFCWDLTASARLGMAAFGWGHLESSSCLKIQRGTFSFFFFCFLLGRYNLFLLLEERQNR